MKGYVRKIGKTGMLWILLAAIVCSSLSGQAWAAELPQEAEQELDHAKEDGSETVPEEESKTDENASQTDHTEPDVNLEETSDTESEPDAGSDFNTEEGEDSQKEPDTEEETESNPDIVTDAKEEEPDDVTDAKEEESDDVTDAKEEEPDVEADPQTEENDTKEPKEALEMRNARNTSEDQSQKEEGKEDKTDQTPTNGLMWQEHGYVLYIDQLLITEEGWKEVSGEKFLVGKEGYVVSRMEEEKGIWRLFYYDSKSQDWIIQKNIWEEALKTEYYFDASGACARLYETETKQLFINDKGKMVLANHKVYELKDGKLYYFNTRGICETTKGWKGITTNEWYYVNQKGCVSSRMINKGGIWKYYNYSRQTWEIQKDVWKEIQGAEYYFNASGKCTKIYDTKAKKCQIYRNGAMVSLKNDFCSLRDGKLYFFNKKGIRVTKAGWQKISDKKYVQIGKKGYIAYKLEKAKDAWKYQSYDDKKNTWKNKKDVWAAIDGKEFYFNKNGTCTKLYTKKTKKCQVYRNGKMVTLKKDICSLKDKKLYFFNEKGICTKKAGWQKISGKKYIQVGKKGYVVCNLEKSKDAWKYQSYNYEKMKWEKRKNVWVAVDGKEYYFNKSGKCTTLYTKKTKKCQVYRNGKMVTLKNDVCTLKNGKIYYFNGKGIRTTKKGWQKISGKKYIQIGSKGYVASKIEKTKNNWNYHTYSYQKKKWMKQKNTWVTVLKKKYYFNGSGNCIYLYDSGARTYYDCKNGTMTPVKNDVRKIGKKEYYFGNNGIKSSAPGLYLTASKTLIYAEADGGVTKKIYGEIQSYTATEGRITSCRVKEDHYMIYYNSKGDAVRNIDLYKPMVALTYDDGPSIHTWAILDVLAQHGGVATFFVVGQQIPGNSAAVKRAVELGCEIGNHTYSHQRLTGLGTAGIQNQIWITNYAVQNAAGVCPVVMRPPGGGYDSTVRNTVGMPIILWSIDTLDWKTRNAASTQAAVLNHVKDGDIVLMHDLYSQTADASRVIIPQLQSRGYQLVTVSELADCRGPIYGGGVYHSLP